MKLRSRLLLTLVAIAVLLAGPAIYALSTLTELRDIANQQRNQHARALMQHGELTTSLAELDRYLRGYIIEGSDDQRAGVENALLAARARLDTLSEIVSGSPTEAAEVTLAQIEGATRNIVAMIEGGRAQDATQYFETVKPLLTRSQNSLQQISAAIDARSRRGVIEAQSISSSAATTTLVVLLVCLAAASVLGIWTAASFTRPILQLRRTMGAVAEGDFNVPRDLDYDRADEIGDLTRSFSWMTQQLSRLDQMKAEFISIATHELKTPINVINGYTELLEEGLYGTPTQKQSEALQTIEEQTRVLTSLVNQLLDISRFEAGGLQLEMQDILLNDLFERVERSFAVLARKKNIDFNVDIQSTVPPAIQGDADRLADQVLGNLLSNAIKFTPDGGTVQLRAWGEANQLRIEVVDTGEGIPRDQLPFIFDKYYQVSQHARTKGAGLGLAIAREVVEAHGGTISVDSQPQRGSTFTISIPVRRARVRQGSSLAEKTA